MWGGGGGVDFETILYNMDVADISSYELYEKKEHAFLE